MSTTAPVPQDELSLSDSRMGLLLWRFSGLTRLLNSWAGAWSIDSTSRSSLEHERGRWRSVFFGLGVVTLFWLWPWFAVTRRGFLQATAQHGPIAVSYGQILQCREFRGVALGHFSVNYAFYFVVSWLPAFLVNVAAIYGACSLPMA